MRAEEGAAGKPDVALAIADVLVSEISLAIQGRDKADSSVKAVVLKARDVSTHKGEALDLMWGAGVTTGYYMALTQLTETIERVMKEVTGE